MTALFNYARGLGAGDEAAMAQAKVQVTQIETKLADVLRRPLAAAS